MALPLLAAQGCMGVMALPLLAALAAGASNTCQPGEFRGGPHLCEKCPSGQYSDGGECSPCGHGLWTAGRKGHSVCVRVPAVITFANTGIRPICKKMDGSVYVVCGGDEKVTKWGIGPEGEAQAHANCKWQATTVKPWGYCQAPITTTPPTMTSTRATTTTPTTTPPPLTTTTPTKTTTPLSCGKGYYALATRGSCEPCATGRFNDHSDAAHCTECAADTYQDGVGQKFCRPCPQGRYTAAATGAKHVSACVAAPTPTPTTTQAPCAPGKYVNDEWFGGPGRCKACPPGQFSREAHAHACTECPRNHVQPAKGKSACEPCPRNHTTRGMMGLTVCEALSPTSAPTATTTAATTPAPPPTCPKGHFRPNPQQPSLCDPCPAGHFNGVTDSAACEPCAYDYYQPDAGQPTCIPCPHGTWTATRRGFETCVAAPTPTPTTAAPATTAPPTPVPTTPPPTPAPIDCIMDAWSAWTPCSRPCTRASETKGKRFRVRVVLVPAQHGGTPCPDQMEMKPCNRFDCAMLGVGVKEADGGVDPPVCPSVPVVRHAGYVSTGLTRGSHATYSCAGSHHLDGFSRVECFCSGNDCQWTAPPRCLPTRTAAPTPSPTPNHALGRCTCNPAAQDATDVTCMLEEHTCARNGTDNWRSWHGACDGKRRHTSLRVRHIHGARVHKHHVCKMLPSGECGCCDCDRTNATKDGCPCGAKHWLFSKRWQFGTSKFWWSFRPKEGTGKCEIRGEMRREGRSVDPGDVFFSGRLRTAPLNALDEHGMKDSVLRVEGTWTEPADTRCPELHLPSHSAEGVFNKLEMYEPEKPYFCGPMVFTLARHTPNVMKGDWYYTSADPKPWEIDWTPCEEGAWGTGQGCSSLHKNSLVINNASMGMDCD
eukprot:g2004.t1